MKGSLTHLLVVSCSSPEVTGGLTATTESSITTRNPQPVNYRPLIDTLAAPARRGPPDQSGSYEVVTYAECSAGQLRARLARATLNVCNCCPMVGLAQFMRAPLPGGAEHRKGHALAEAVSNR